MILSGTQLLEALIEKRTNSSGEKLAVILVGDDPASRIYVKAKMSACAKAKIETELIELPAEINQARLSEEIQALNCDKSMTGILLQLPLPGHLCPVQATALIDPKKDVDGLSPTNMGKLLIGDPTGLVPCTPLGITMLLEHYGLSVSGKRALILGRSLIVGRPLAALWMHKGPKGNATVTLAHSLTRDLDALILESDIIVAAMGRPASVTKVKKGAIVIDVGITDQGKAPSGKRRLQGDVDFDAVEPLASYITPVPGGVGPMTIAALISNIERAAAL